MKNNMITWRRAWDIRVSFSGWRACLSAYAQTVVEAVTSSMQGGVEVVRIDFSQPLQAVPAGFAIQAPARIALDVPGATNGLGRSTVRDQPGQPAFRQRGAGR